MHFCAYFIVKKIIIMENIKEKEKKSKKNKQTKNL
jgi:uncharacterized protein YutD